MLSVFLLKIYNCFQVSLYVPPVLTRNMPTPIYGGGGIDLHKFSKYNEITE